MLRILSALMLIFLLSACGIGQTPAASPTPATPSTASPSGPVTALVNGTLIDGSGAAPLKDAVLVISGERISAVGPRGSTAIPAGARIIDLGGGTILPGFINAHVHDAYDAGRLKAWAQGGVTTVRDEGLLSGTLADALALRRKLAPDPQYARLVSAGLMIAPPGGYGRLYVSTPEEAALRVQEELDQGVDQIKFALESGYAGNTNLPVLSEEMQRAITTAARQRGARTSAHITAARFLVQAVNAGADDIAHISYDPVPEATVAKMVRAGIYLVPTLTVFEAYGALEGASASLRRLNAAGVRLGFGNDYTLVPQNGFNHFDLGMPMHEILRLSESGLTPMQIIVSATRNSAAVCGLEKELGTLTPGKLADVLVVQGDPLADLQALSRPTWVIHSGVVIRQP